MKRGTMTCMPLRLGKVALQGLPVLYEELSSSGQHTSLIRDCNRCLDERLCVSYCWHCFWASACITHLLPNVNLWQNKCNICKPWRVILTNVFSSSSSLGDDLCRPDAGSDGRRASGRLNEMDIFGIVKYSWSESCSSQMIDPQWQLSARPKHHFI